MSDYEESEQSPLDKVRSPHPGRVIRGALKGAGFSIPSAAIAMAVNRANLNNLILGKAALSRDMAYRLNVLIDPSDEHFELARQLLGLQANHDWDKDVSIRNVVRAAVNAGRKYGEMHEAGTDGHLTLTAAGLRHR